MAQMRKYASAAARQAAYRDRREEARIAQLQERGLPPLPALPAMPGYARWKAALQQASQALTLVSEEMTCYFEARSETWQQSDRGEEHLARVSAVEEVLEAVEELQW